MQRLLCILSSMNAGGAETFLIKMMRQIDKNKYNFDYCINNENSFYEEEIVKMGGKIFVIPNKSKSLYKFKKELTKIIKENDYKYVMRITSNGMGFMDLAIAKMAGAKTCIARSSNSSDGIKISTKILHYVGRFLFKKYIDIEIAPSDLAAVYTFGKGDYNKGKVHILNNGIDINKYKYNEGYRKAIRKENNIPDDSKVFGHVGRFATQKNHFFLLKVFRDILRINNNSYLLLIGEGELKEKVKELAIEMCIDNRVIMLDTKQDIEKYYSAMDVYVFPSLYEGMPNTVIEAQASGVHCLISDSITKQADLTGLVEYLPIDDSDCWAKKSVELSLKKRVDVSKLLVNRKYDIKSTTDKFIDIVFNGKGTFKVY